VGELGYSDTQRPDQSSEIQGGRVAFYAGIHREEYFADRGDWGAEAIEKFPDF
jgi:hypothetical protein